MRWLVVVLLAVGMAAAPMQIGASEPAAKKAEFRPAAVYNQSGRFDKAFNESIVRGIERFRAEAGVAVTERPVREEDDVEQTILGLAQSGFDPILVGGFSFAPATESVARKFPGTRFVLMDSAAKGANIQSFLFQEHEGSYLVGLLAAMKSKSGILGFIGGMESPTIRRFSCGFVQGARAARPDIVVIEAVVGNSFAAWNDPERARSIANGQLARGADVIFAAAGRSGLGALAAAAEAGRFGIGVDSNQNALFPGQVLTSMLKRVDIATYRALKGTWQGQWKPGITVLGLAEDGIGWAQDQHNALIITDEMFSAVEEAREAIVGRRLQIHDFTTDNNCSAATKPTQR